MCEKIYANLRISIDSHGYPWISMDFHKYPWISMDMDAHALPWIYMDFNGYPWISMCILRFLWKFIGGSRSLGSEGSPPAGIHEAVKWKSMDVCLPWICTDIYEWPLISIEFHGFQENWKSICSIPFLPPKNPPRWLKTPSLLSTFAGIVVLNFASVPRAVNLSFLFCVGPRTTVRGCMT